MKKTTLFQLGGVALLLAAILYIIGNLIYVLSGQPDAPTTVGLLIAYFGDILMLLGLGALFARQSHQGGILGLIGFVLLVIAQAFFFGSYSVSLEWQPESSRMNKSRRSLPIIWRIPSCPCFGSSVALPWGYLSTAPRCFQNMPGPFSS